MDKDKILAAIFEGGGQKQITHFTTVVGAAVLIYATFKNVESLATLYGLFMTYGGGLTISKGLVDLKRGGENNAGEG